MLKTSKIHAFIPVILSGFLPVITGWAVYQTQSAAGLPLPLRFAFGESLVMGVCYFTVPALILRRDFRAFLAPALIFACTFAARTFTSLHFVFLLLYGVPVLFIAKSWFFSEGVSSSFFRTNKTPALPSVLFGVAGGVLLLAHLFVTLSFVGSAHVKPLAPVDAMYWFLYGLFLSGFYEEFFYRGFLMKKFSEFHFTFWESSLSSLSLYVLKYATLPRIYETPSLAFGTLFYAGLVSVVSALLLRKTGNLWACVLMNAVFYTGASFVA